MRVNSETGALELGPAEGTSFVAITLIPPRPGQPPPDLVDRAVEAVRSLSMEWDSVQNIARRQSLSFPASSQISRTPGVIGMDLERNLQIHFYHRDRQPLDALYAIEQAEGGLPPALAGAVLAASRAKKLPTRAPALFAKLCDCDPQPAPSPCRANRAELEQAAAEFFATLAGKSEAVLVPDSSVDRARFWLIVGQRLWQPGVQAQIASNRTVDPFARDLAAEAAMLWLSLQDITHTETTGIPLHIPEPLLAIQAWPQTMEWTLHGISPQALRFLVGSRMPEGFDVVGGRWIHVEAPVIDGDDDLCRGLAVALLREAEEQAEFVPNGAFVLALPDGYPLQAWGVASLRVWADPGGLWLGVVTEGGETGSCFRWQPRQALSRWLIKEAYEPLLQATLAALWRDLRVAGEEAVPPAETDRAAAGRARRPGQGERRQQRKAATRVLPSPIHPGLSGMRTWGSDQERETIQRRTHGVRGHLRLLRAGHRTGDETRKVAAEFGVVIPAGRTFVRPHVRGSEPAAEEQVPGETVVKARGLASVMALVAGATKGKKQNAERFRRD